MNKSRVSVIVVYTNSENTIKECVESILKQNFQDFELICVNNASSDNSEMIVMENTKDFPNVKRISLPSFVSEDDARKTALSVISGQYVCFVESTNVLDEGFLGSLILENLNTKHASINVVYNELYNREFLENNKVLNRIIEEKFAIASEALRREFQEYKNILKEDLENNSKNNIENVNNKNYELWNRFAQLEKTVFEKDAMFWNGIESASNVIRKECSDAAMNAKEEISKVYEYISEQMNVKTDEIQKLYEEINKSGENSQTLVAQAKEEISKNQDVKETSLNERIYLLEKEIIVRYVNMKRLLDMQIDEINSRIGDDVPSRNVDLSKDINENIEKIKSQINVINSQFYEELTKIYQDLNTKLTEKMNEQQSSFEQKINELYSRLQVLEEKSGI